MTLCNHVTLILATLAAAMTGDQQLHNSMFCEENEEILDKDKDVFIGPKEFVSHMMMTQTKYRLYHQLK